LTKKDLDKVLKIIWQ